MADFEMSRSAHVDADPATVYALIDDFRQLTRWSPWEGTDPDLRRTYSGMRSDVTWTMTGTRSAIMGLAGKLFFDKAIGKDFDKGLAALKAAAEG